MNHPIVVGVDGSEPSRRALYWAVDEALRRRLPLRVVHAWMGHTYTGPPVPMVVDGTADRALGAEILTRAERRVRDRAPDLELDVRLVHDAAVRALLDEGESASLVVVGSRGHGGFTGLLLGSVSLAVSARVACPVVVARAEPGELRGPDQRPEVVLGVDGRKPCPASVEFAFTEASQRGVRLRALHAWTHPLPSGPGDMLPLVYDPAEENRSALREMSETLAGWREKFPDVEVVQNVVNTPAAKALVAASTAADLTVVGAHRRQGRIGLALGPVNHAVLHHAASPVAVVPEGDGRPARRGGS